MVDGCGPRRAAAHRPATYLPAPGAIASCGDGAADTSNRTAARRQSSWRSRIYDAKRLRQFAREHGGALVESWQLFGGAPSLFNAAAE